MLAARSLPGSSSVVVTTVVLGLQLIPAGSAVSRSPPTRLKVTEHQDGVRVAMGTLRAFFERRDYSFSGKLHFSRFTLLPPGTAFGSVLYTHCVYINSPPVFQSSPKIKGGVRKDPTHPQESNKRFLSPAAESG